MRAFIAVELTDEIRKKIAQAVEGLKKTSTAVKWVEEKDLHITLKFLGEVEEKDLETLMELTAKAVSGTGSFPARFAGMGTFPAGNSPHVVWVGTVEGGGKLGKLASSLGEREFISHITIGRIKNKKGVDELLKKMAALKSSVFGEMRIDRICIMKSTLTPKGPIYEKIKEVII